MALKAIYERFLTSPNPLSLSESASLHYVTTLTSYTQQGPIIRHLESQNKNLVRKKAEKILTVVEGTNALALEVDTTLEIVSNGGAYLPGLDNFIVDRVVTFPVTHIVHFDKDQKISQIRLTWDQGSLLQQVEVIGARGRNWPLTSGKDQIRLISTSASSAAATAPATSVSRGRTEEYSYTANRNPSPSKKYIKDPHASLDVFSPPTEDENRRPTTSGSDSVAVRASAKPPPREYSELFAAGHEDFAPSPNGSPNKAHRESVIAPKGAGARRFESSRLFEDDQDYKEPKIYKTNPARYNHFDIGDADDDDPMQHKTNTKANDQHVPLVARSKKSASQWDFDDFNTPEKLPQRARKDDQVNFSLGIDENRQNEKSGHVAKGRKDAETHFDFIDNGTPIQKQPAQPKPRKDAETHFDFRDDTTPAPRRIIARTKAAEGIYSNPLEEDNPYSQEKKPALSTITNNAAARRQAFESHWDAADESPDDSYTKRRPLGANQAQAVNSMSSQWDSHDVSPEPTRKPAATKARNGLTSSWSFQDD